MSGLPNLYGPVRAWGQRISLVVVGREQRDYTTVETFYPTDTYGVIMPLKAEALELKPEGERSWAWSNLFCSPSLALKVGDVIIYQSIRQRVRGKKDYTAYGYIEYELVEDYAE